MSKRLIILFAVAALAVGVLAPAASAHSGSEREWLVLGGGNKLSNKTIKAIEAAGGTVDTVYDEIGIAVVTASDGDADAIGSLRGVSGMAPNVNLQWVDPVETVFGADFGNPPTSGDDDFFFDLQWGHDAVDAPEAWNAGARGAGVRVAVLDTGFDLLHPDLSPNIVLSTNFTPQGPANGQYVLPDPFSHGSHTAGTVAAADNAFGTIGVAPEADLLLGKVLADQGFGDFDWVIAGILWAVDNDADVISMSLGARLEKDGFFVPPDFTTFITAREVQELKNAIGRATTHAYQNGVTVIASAGNDGEDYDHNGPAIHLPSDAPHVLSISATGPRDWANNPATDLDLPAVIGFTGDPTYTNHGQSVIDFAAPGGSIYFDLPGFCTIAGLTRPCFVFDLVFSTGNGAWFWSAGTSMSAPHVAGTAAIIIGANSGDMHPAQVARELRKAADDLGKPGNDDFYGKGRVNAANAVD